MCTMSNAIITFEIMPESPEADFQAIKEAGLKICAEEGAKGNMESNIEPLAFGLKRITIMGMYEVSDDKDFDQIADRLAGLEGVTSAKVAKMDLAMG